VGVGEEVYEEDRGEVKGGISLGIVRRRGGEGECGEEVEGGGNLGSTRVSVGWVCRGGEWRKWGKGGRGIWDSGIGRVGGGGGGRGN